MSTRKKITKAIAQLNKAITRDTRELQALKREFKKDFPNPDENINGFAQPHVDASGNKKMYLKKVYLPQISELAGEVIRLFNSAQTNLKAKEFEDLAQSAIKQLMAQYERHLITYRLNYRMEEAEKDSRLCNPVDINADPIKEQATYGIIYLSLVGRLRWTASRIQEKLDYGQPFSIMNGGTVKWNRSKADLNELCYALWKTGAILIDNSPAEQNQVLDLFMNIFPEQKLDRKGMNDNRKTSQKRIEGENLIKQMLGKVKEYYSQS